MLERTVMLAKLGNVGGRNSSDRKISCSRTLVLTNTRNLRIVGFPHSYY